MEKKEVISSMIWKLSERIGVQGVQFLVNIILARLLEPEDYGTIALITVFITLANVTVQGGFNTALIQKKNPDRTDYSTVFYFSLAVSCVIYAALFFLAPVLSAVYREPVLTPVVRVLGLTVVAGSVNSIQTAYAQKNMKYKCLFCSSLSAIAVSGCTGVFMAYKGYGVWALAGQQLTNISVSVIVMFFTVKWKPALDFSKSRLHALVSFGWKILASNFLTTFFLNLRSLLIGRIYTSSMLAYYERGKQFPEIILGNVSSAIQPVMLTAYSSEQENLTKVKNMVRKSMRTCIYLTAPMMTGLMCVCEPLVRLMLTDKWTACVPYMRVQCLIYLLLPITTTNLQAVSALGKSDVILRLDIQRKIVELAVLFLTIRMGVWEITLGALVSAVIGTAINIRPNVKILGYSYKEQICDFAPGLGLSALMGISVSLSGMVVRNDFAKLCIQTVTGAVLYLFLSWLFNIDVFREIIGVIRNKNRS